MASDFRLETKRVIPAKAGIQRLKNSRVAGQCQGFAVSRNLSPAISVVRFAKVMFSWIPAFAGMTELMVNLK
jgi:hypothetical protein